MKEPAYPAIHSSDSQIFRRPLGRRGFLQCVTAGAGGLILASCSQGSATAQKPGDAVHLEYWTFLDPKGTDPRAKAEMQIFANLKERDNIVLDWHIIPWQTIDVQLLAAIQAGNAPQISRIRGFSYQRDAAAGALLDLTSYAKKSFTQEDLADFVGSVQNSKGKIDSFRIENIANALYVRTDWLKSIGLAPPETWDEFVQVGLALKKFKPNVIPYLTSASTVQLNHVLMIFQPMIMGRGGRVLDEGGRAAFNSQAGQETFAYLRDLVFKHGIMSKDAISMTFDDVTDAFMSGRGAMMIEGSNRFSKVSKKLGESVSVVKIPGVEKGKPSPTVMDGWKMIIPKGSSAPDEAWKALQFRISPDSQELFAKVAGGLPTRGSVLERPFFKTPEASIIRWWTKYEVENGADLDAPVHATELNKLMAEALQRAILEPETKMAGILATAADSYNSLL